MLASTKPFSLVGSNMYADDLSIHLCNPARLAALRAEALLDTPTDEAFDRLSRLAARLVKAPVDLVLLVVADRKFFKICIGLPEPWRSLRETPLSHSFCQHNRIAGHPLLIEDARTHPLVNDNLAIRELNVIAYLGIPLVTSDGYVLCSFCVIDSKPRWWGGGRHRHPGLGCSGDDRDPATNGDRSSVPGRRGTRQPC